MVEDVPLVRILIASPSDLAEERAAAEEAITKLNKTALHTLGLTLAALRSEDDIYPGIGRDAQDVINQQLGDRHDILLGIMGARFGTATGRAGSGTEEEFDRALKRHEASRGSVAIMMYFKDVEVPRDKASLLQALQVEEFRARLEKAGVFYKTFKDIRHLANLLDVDLPLCLRDRFSKSTSEGRKAVAALPTITNEEVRRGEEPPDEDFGYLDYVELFEDSMGRLGSFASKVSEEMEKFNKKTQERTADLQQCKSPTGNIDVKKAKMVTNKAAADYDELATIMSHYIEMLSKESQKAVDALHGALAVAADFHHPTEDEKKRVSEDIESFLDAVRSSRESVWYFKESVEKLPRVTSRLNKAKKNIGNALLELSSELEKTESMFAGVLGPIKRL